MHLQEHGLAPGKKTSLGSFGHCIRLLHAYLLAESSDFILGKGLSLSQSLDMTIECCYVERHCVCLYGVEKVC